MNQQLANAVAIFVGFAMIAGVIFVSGPPAFLYGGEQVATPERPAKQAFVYGNPKAKTTIVEFSDYECPFCAKLHPTLKQIVDESEGTINWQCRHLPLPIHQHADHTARVAECVGREVGNEAFWEYSDTIFANQASLDKGYANQVAIDLGLTSEALEACIATEAVGEQIALDKAVATAFGGSGTPFSVIVFPDGTTKPVTGAVPYEQFNAVLNE
jgi:protein-disulfide isomerase